LNLSSKWHARPGPKKSLGNARAKWDGRPGHPGEASDPYIELCFRAQDPLNDEFVQLAEELLRPLRAAELEE